ncbi:MULTISPECIES: D-alanyl-D-alanine carboxypeptidase/D-alanyl-D-alanine-endopeptidase [unclassified Corynebacterium]|uniref:D-alanyl-D-alanine carboxypeptidase/D-alanyl-D-alanine endopeptidase n=1 Tax=unclassified Corynebacterium TaxID=2624378 RepID=UPI0008A4069B|nr:MULTISPECIES: D-alanyl-D-alanine carboxypeptidase/D-alanyl-D-alanine-endopeptidase [unclassified Corynebacterium]OFN75081.1 D-alanyl-D-alanine carboxypeptidase [Corynebacterium sp. HMSC074E01]OFP65942.1 D-alanyl-D-alanine carboxypeptidase [Corynebacterium sp. HMSC074C01]OHO65337.1 D-alanyl-D-alanine carboxypeptidase [Corynebacterium sp. HMSC036D02]
MKAKHVWWSTAALVTAGAVAATAAVGVEVQRTYDHLDHGQPYKQEEPTTLVQPVEPGEIDTAALKAKLDELGKDKALATFGGQVIDTTTHEVLWEREPAKPLTPASATKVLTLAAATLALDEEERLTTEVVAGEQEGEVVIKAAGDVWLTDERLDELAKQIQQKMDTVTRVSIDTSIWAGPDQAPGWDDDNIDGGYVAPIQPAMLYGGRIGEKTGDVPRSHEPALDVARALATRLGADEADIAASPENSEVIASSESEPLALRAQQAAKDSDNVMAEAIARELAVSQGREASFEGATKAILDELRGAGIDVNGVTLKDGSGLSRDNRIPAGLLAHIADQAVATDELRPLLGYLPLAGGEGTLYERYHESPARGYVRAKTGTLTGTSALTGTAQGQSGRVYAFAFLVNDGEVTSARQAQDALAAALHDF